MKYCIVLLFFTSFVQAMEPSFDESKFIKTCLDFWRIQQFPQTNQWKAAIENQYGAGEKRARYLMMLWKEHAVPTQEQFLKHYSALYETDPDATQHLPSMHLIHTSAQSLFIELCAIHVPQKKERTYDESNNSIISIAPLSDDEGDL